MIKNYRKQKGLLSLSIRRFFYLKQVGLALVGSLALFTLPVYAASFSAFDTESQIGSDEFKDSSGFGFNNNEVEHYLKLYDQPQLVGTSRNQAINQVNKGIELIRIGEKEQGINILNQTWETYPKIKSAGVIIAVLQLQEKDYANVVETTKKLQKIHPDFPKSYVLQGIAYSLLNENDKAKTAFDKAYALNPGEPEINANLALLELQEGDLGKAEFLYKEILINYPRNLNALLSLAQIAINAGQLTKAALFIEDTVRYHPLEIKPYVLLTKIYLSIDDTEKAVNTISKALEKFPDNVIVKEMAGYAYLQNGMPEKAINILNSVVESSPNLISPYYLLALSYENLGKNKSALIAIDKGLSLDAVHGPLRFVKARILALQGNLEAAKDILQQLVKEFPNRIEAYELLARIAIHQNHPEQAVKHLRSAMDIQESQSLNMQLATALTQAGDNDSAFAVLQDWVKKHPEAIPTRVVLADSFMAQRQYEQAGKIYLEILALQPNRISTINNLALLLSRQGKHEQAIKYAKKAQKLAPKHPQIMDTLGFVYLQHHKYKEAGIWLQKASGELPDDPAVQFHLAQYFAKVGQNKKAKALLKETLNKSANFFERQDAIALLNALNAQ